MKVLGVLSLVVNTLVYFVGVFEFMTAGKVSTNHQDFKEYSYEQVLKPFSHHKVNNSLTHPFSMKSAYDRSIMEFTNFT